MEDCKRIIQKGFRLQLGLIVDRPKPGYGSTNDGNTTSSKTRVYQLQLQASLNC